MKFSDKKTSADEWLQCGLAIVLLLVVLSAGAAFAQSTGGPGKRTVYISDAYNHRFCEVDLLSGTPPDIFGAVYNTLGENDCPQDKFDALNAEALAKENHVEKVFLNTPRNLVMSKAWLYDVGATKDFNGLKANWVGTISLKGVKVGGEKKGFPSYRPSTIQRHTKYLYTKGTRVFLIVQPDGKTWVMQTYTNTIDPTQTLSGLPDLGAKLKNLPSGWQFKTKVLDKDLTIIPPLGSGKYIAHIMADELDDAYEGCGFDTACNYTPLLSKIRTSPRSTLGLP